MQRFDLNKNLTQYFNGDADINMQNPLVGLGVYTVWGKMIIAWYIHMDDANENTNFVCDAGLVDMELGSQNFLIRGPGGSWTFSVKFHPWISATPET